MLTAFTLAGDKSAQQTVFDLGPANELPEKMGEPLYHRRGRFWLLHNDDGLLAITNTCSHLECLFAWNGEVGSFVCPCHGSRFDRHGRVLSGPAKKNLQRYRLQLIDRNGAVLASSGQNGEGLAIPTFASIDVSAESTPVPHLRIETSANQGAAGV